MKKILFGKLLLSDPEIKKKTVRGFYGKENPHSVLLHALQAVLKFKNNVIVSFRNRIYISVTSTSWARICSISSHTNT